MYRLRIERLAASPSSSDIEELSRLYLVADEGQRITLFAGELGYDSFTRWCRINRSEILSTEIPPFSVGDDESLSHAYGRAYDAAPDVYSDTPGDDPAAINWSKLTKWDESHCLVHAAKRGTVLPHISLGTGSSGPEISCSAGSPLAEPPRYYTGNEWNWRYYPVDYVEFFDWLLTAQR